MNHPDNFQFIPKKGFGYVYHIISGNKHYIGISTTSFSKRWARHVAPTSGCIKLKRELRRLRATGEWNNLRVQILEQSKNQRLDSLQKKYIKKYGSYKSLYGLNSTPGGRQTTPDSMHQKKHKVSVKRKLKRIFGKPQNFTWEAV